MSQQQKTAFLCGCRARVRFSTDWVCQQFMLHCFTSCFRLSVKEKIAMATRIVIAVSPCLYSPCTQSDTRDTKTNLTAMNINVFWLAAT